MPITIGSNIQSLGAQRRLSESSSHLSGVFERLSSGQRINRASDDAAGLAIATTLNTGARVFRQAQLNLNDGISYLSIAGGALENLKTILIRGKELAEQAANGTYSDVQRSALNNELQAIEREYNRIIETTEFNGTQIFSYDNRNLMLQAGFGTQAILQATVGTQELVLSREMQAGSVSAAGELPNASAGAGMVTDNGRYLFFSSTATNLISGDTNGVSDIFRRDLITGDVVLVTSGLSGAQSNGTSFLTSISSDGRYVVFRSSATNLVSGDTNGVNDIFVKDMLTGSTTLVSRDSSGVLANAQSDGGDISADGRYVVFHSFATNLVAGDTNGSRDVFKRDLLTGATTRVSVSSAGVQGDSFSDDASVSADGRYVAFRSAATNLVVGDTNAWDDIFVRDTVAGTTVRVSVSTGGVQGNSSSGVPTISKDGRFVSFYSYSTNIHTNANNGFAHIFVKNLLTNELELIDVDDDGQQGDGETTASKISGDGRFVVFAAYANNLGDAAPYGGLRHIFVRDRQEGTTALVSRGFNGSSLTLDEATNPRISANGHFITFGSVSSELIEGINPSSSITFLTGSPLTFSGSISLLGPNDISTRSGALDALGIYDLYLQELNDAGSRIGASMSRVNVAYANLTVTEENYLAAESRIKNADIAQESSDLVRVNILQQAASAVLAQANQQPQLALQVLAS